MSDDKSIQAPKEVISSQAQIGFLIVVIIFLAMVIIWVQIDTGGDDIPQDNQEEPVTKVAGQGRTQSIEALENIAEQEDSSVISQSHNINQKNIVPDFPCQSYQNNPTKDNGDYLSWVGEFMRVRTNECLGTSTTAMAEAQELRRKGPQEGLQCKGKDQFNTWAMEMKRKMSECLQQDANTLVEKPARHLVSKPQEENVLVEVLAPEHISKVEDLKGAVQQLSNTKKPCVDDCKVKQEQDLEQKEVESPGSASAEKSLERSVSCFDAKPDFNDCKVKANKGSPTAQYKLGVLYRTGEVVKIDYQEALKWFRKSAAQGNSRARKALREMILKKQGVLLKK